MISQIKNVLSNKVIDNIKDNLGRIVYEAWKDLLASGVPPLTLTKCKGVDLVDYKIYGNSVQNGAPTPEAPIEVQSVGDKTINIFNINSLEEGYIANDNTGNISEAINAKITNYIEISGEVLNFYIYDYKPVFSNNWMLRVAQYNENKEFLRFDFLFDSTYTEGFNKKDIVLKSATKYIRISCHQSHLNSIMVCFDNSETTEYEPFGYKVPVKVKGKNLFDIYDQVKYSFSKEVVISSDDLMIVEFDNTSNTSTKYLNMFTNVTDRLKSETNYLIITEVLELSNCVITPITNWVEGNEITQFASGFKLTTTGTDIRKLKTISDFSKCTSMLRSQITVNAGTIGKIKVRISVIEDTTITQNNFKYESYIEPITTNIYLNEPLRKIGDYADNVDFEDKKVVRKIYEYSFKGDEPFDNNYGVNLFGVQGEFSNKEPITGSGLSNYYKYNPIQSGIEANTTNGEFALQQRYDAGANVFFKDTRYSSVDSFKENLKNLYSKGEPVKVYYPLITPTEEEIELPNIPTHKGTTILSVDTEIQPSNMEVQYYGKSA